MNRTHDPELRSWVESADSPHGDFPIQNLPFGIFSRPGDSERRVGVAIGDQILDVRAALDAKLLTESAAAAACRAGTLNALMSLPRKEISTLRGEMSALLSGESRAGTVLYPMRGATLHVPADIGDYTDFYASIHHATNVGRMFRPDSPLLPNYKHVPIGYHGRASSIVASGEGIRRPKGQTKAADAAAPRFGPSAMLDYECELGFYVGVGNAIGNPIRIDDAADHIFGFSLVNDWSARDIQSWEYQPLGPFLAKNFATTVSPWIVTSEAVEPYRTRGAARAADDPEPLDYLRSEVDRDKGGIAASLEVLIVSARMRQEGIPPMRLSRGSFAGMYWTVAQMLTHHASNGCNLRSGDLLASGTVSNETPESRGCLLELTARGAHPVTLPSGEVRRFLEDGDEIIMRGGLEADGRPRIGFGECRGTILPAHT